MKKKRKSVSYAKWGYIFILPFFITYLIFSLIPLVDTVRFSFFEYYRSGIKQIGPNFVGWANYAELLKSDMITYGKNTLILWVIGFIPQIVVALVLANWFTDARLKIHKLQFFKVVIYLPNLIMASAFALLFFTLFSNSGPVNSILQSMGVISKPIDFMGSVFGTRSLIGFMNFLMWFGNTTIMLMAAVMGISTEVFEAADLDGASEWVKFRKITWPLLGRSFQFVIVQTLISHFQMFAQFAVLILKDGPQNSGLVLSRYIYKMAFEYKDMGYASAVSLVLFVIIMTLSLIEQKKSAVDWEY